MIAPLLKTALEPVVARHRLIRYLRNMAGWLAGFTLLALTLRIFHERFAIPAVLLFVALFIIGRLVARRTNRWEPDYRQIARGIEEQHPDLHALLATAVEQKPDPQTGALSFLQQRVLQQVTAASRRTNWIDAVPEWRLWSWGAVVAALLVTFAWLSYRNTVPVRADEKSAAIVAKAADGVTVTPGDTALERGTGLVVLATFPRNPPSEAVLIIESKDRPAQRIPLTKNLDDPVFGGGLPEVDRDFTYRIAYAGETTRNFTVKVFETPRLDRADATLHYPAYTKLPEKKIADTRRISAVEGSKLDLEFQFNKPVKSATLVAKDGSTVPLAIAAGKPTASLRDFPLKTSQTYTLKLEDADGRGSNPPAQLIVEAVPNRRPELKFQAPKGDQRVSPLEEVGFRAEAWDDFGLARYGLTTNVAGRGEQEIELGRDSKPDERRQLAHMLKLETVGVKPDELVTWYLWAEDTGPDGQPRRTATDLFFGEVRPFEEIFKPGDSGAGGQPPPGGGGGGEQATKLAELQKQVINATWKLQRGEETTAGTATPGAKYLQDEPVVLKGQTDALDQAGALAQKAEDAKAKALVENAVKEMQTARDRLTEAQKTSVPLPAALAAEQAAYNALLKLAAHQFRVVKGRQAGAGSGQQQQQQQLDELEMKDEKKRYETQREAAAPQEQAEQLATLNRLKELAQRQNDINERLKELQTALQAAQNEPEKEEIRRQLKRLREEEQQMLADMDELRQNMEQSPQQAQLAEERKQLEQTRNEAQQTAEALQKNEASPALASGTRAAKNLEQLRDEVRKKTSGEFNDTMREMRNDARQLAEKQEQLAEQLKAQGDQPERRSLTEDSTKESLAGQFTKQQAELDKLSEQMRQTSEKAEAAEPLLARELYDTLRQTTQAGTAQTLAQAQQLAQRGNREQAQQFNDKAQREIDDLKAGVERAAESVLGDEAEALRQARAELDALADPLNRELARARPDLAQQSKAGPQPGENAPAAPASANDPQGKKGEPGTSPATASEGRPEGPPGSSSAPTQTAGNPQKPQPGSAPGRTAAQGSPGQPPRGESPNGQTPGGQAPGGQATPGEQAANGQSPNRQARNGQPPNGQSPTGRTPGGQTPGEQPAPGGQAPGGQAPGGQAPGGAGTRLGQGRGAAGGTGGGGETANEAATAESAGPLTGESFVQWSDRLRNVEEMIDKPELRTEVARIREAAQGLRAEFKRHSVQPNWDLVEAKIRAPLAELRTRLGEELARRESKENLVPIDRDPVPAKYAERVRRYYEDLGQGR